MATVERYRTTACTKSCGPDIEACRKQGHTKYRVRYRKPDGRQTDKRGFKRKEDAKTFSNTVEVDKLTGNYIAPSLGRITVSQLGTDWFEGREAYSQAF